jgi:biofilm PGA synthesis protein PgaA
MECGLRGCWVLLLAALALAGGLPDAHAQTATQQREAAILKARAGEMAEAQASLRAMLAAGMDDGLAMDLVTLLQQGGKHAEAIAVFEKAAKSDPPDYALLAATRAYRDLRRYEDAARRAREGQRRFPNDTVWPLVLSLVLSDAGRTGEALDVLRSPAAMRASPVERLLAEGYAYRRAGNTGAALRAYGLAIRLSGGNQGVRNEAADVLLDVGAPWGAATIAGNTRPIEAQQAGAMVRWGAQVRSPEPARRFEGTDAALARLDTLLASLPADDKDLRRRLRVDRMVALRDRVRMKEAMEEGEALGADGPLPAFGEQAYADSLLYMRRPEQARDAYNRVLAQYPSDVQARYGAFFAAVELEDFASAYATIDSLVNDEPVPERPNAPSQSRAWLRRDHGGSGTLLRQSTRRGLGPADPPIRSRTRQRQHTSGALSSGERTRLAAPRRGGGADRREPGTPRCRLAHRPDRGRRQRLSLH